MAWKTDRYRELRSLLRRGRVEEEVDEELLAHLEMQQADNVARGMSEEAARADALRRFGNIERIRQETVLIERSAINEERRMEVFGSLRRETRHAARTIIRKPGFAVVAILTLALGLGGTTAIFALLDSVVLNPLPYAASHELAHLSSAVPRNSQDAEWGLSQAGYFHFAKNNRSFESMGASYSSSVNAVSDGPAERLRGINVTRSFLDVLAARPHLGRLFTAEEDAPRDPAPVVLLSYDYWRTRYGSDEAAVGKALEISGTPHTIVGVLERGFQPPHGSVDVWLPAGFDPAAPPVNSHFLSVVARLKPGATAESANADLTRLTSEFTALFPTAYPETFMRETGFATRVTSLRDKVVGDTGRVLWLLLAAVGLVLVIACANVANLFLVRTEARQREIAVRTALGAERLQLAVHYVAESMLLCTVAAFVALALAWAGLKLFVGLTPTGIPRLEEVTLGRDAVLVTFACAMTAGILFGLFPLFRSAGNYDALRDGGRASTPSRSRNATRGALVVSQVALSLLLLGGAGLLLRSFNALRSVDPGVQTDGVLTFELTLPWQAYGTPDEKVAFYRVLTEQLSALPGVQHVGVGNYVPLRGANGCALVFFEGRQLRPGEQAPCPFVAEAGPGVFEALGMRVRGRTLTWNDVTANSDAALVTAAFADKYWPGEDPIGKGVRGNGDEPPYYRVVGVVENALNSRVDEPPVEGVFYPLRPIPGANLWSGNGATTVVVRTALADPVTLVPRIREILTGVDRGVPLANPRTLEDIVLRSMERTSLTMLLLVIAAVMSLLLSGVGLYGVVSYVVNQRRAEIGVRIALGARLAQVRGLVLGQSLRLAVLGVALGVLASFGATRVLRSFLYGVSPADPVTLTAVSLLLIGVAAAASWIPAMRAARVQPMQVLRED